MSVSLDRFIRVMTGGLVVSDELVIVRYDKVQEGLVAARAQLGRLTQAGLTANPAYVAQLQGLEQRLAMAMAQPTNQEKCDAIEPLKEALRAIAERAERGVDEMLADAADVQHKAAAAAVAIEAADRAVLAIPEPAFRVPLDARLAAIRGTPVAAAAATTGPQLRAAVAQLDACLQEANAVAADAAGVAQLLAGRAAKVVELDTALAGLSLVNATIGDVAHKTAADTALAALTLRRGALAIAGPGALAQEMGRAAALLADIAAQKTMSDQRVAWLTTKARRDLIRKDADEYEAVGKKEHVGALEAGAAKLGDDLGKLETLSLTDPKAAADGLPKLEADHNKLKVQFKDTVAESQLLQRVADLVATQPDGPEAQMQVALGVDKSGGDVFQKRLLAVYKTARFQGSPEINLVGPGEAVAIHTYTTDDYQQMNGYLFGMPTLPPPKDTTLLPPTVDQVKIKNKQTIDALAKLPVWTGGMTRRGSGPFPNDDVDFVLGNTFAIKAFWSTDKKQPFPGKWQISVFGKTGKNVAMMSAYPKEDEVLFIPGTRFTVTDYDDSDPSSIQIVVEEVV